jgi:FMN phosphatase YigB (HAD superfamily)
MIKGIRHIIFDLGGVLLNLDYSRTEQAFRDLGIKNFDEMFSQLKQTPLFDDLEVGRIGRAEFVHGVRAAAGIEVSDEEILKAWNAMLMDFPLHRLQLLQQLRLHYDLFLLSNTNEVHEEAFNLILNQAHGISIAMLFDKVYLSHRIAMRKPDAVVFQHILDENGLQAQHTLFIDDSPQHIEAAKTLGIQTVWLEQGMTIEEHIFKRPA